MGIGTHGAFWYIREVVPVPLKGVPVPLKGVPVPLKVVPVPTGSEELVPVPVKVVPVPLLPATLNWHNFAPLSPVFVHDCLGTLRND